MSFEKTNHLVLLCLILANSWCLSSSAEDWLRFRGPNGTGVSESSVVTEFGEDNNLNWKTELPGAGASCPIVVGNRVFVTCYSGYGESRKNVGDMNSLMRHIVCVNRDDGEILWHHEIEPYLPEDEFKGMGVPEHGYSSSTPVSDGEHVFVFFGKSGVIAYDIEGNELWKTSVGTSSGSRKWGSAASPVLVENILIVNASDEDGAIYGFDKKTGEQVWKVKKKSLENLWNTPVVAGDEDQKQLLISVPKEVWALNPKNGKLKWYTTNGVEAPSVSTSLVLDGDTVIAMGGRSRTCTAIRTGGKSDVTESNTVWKGSAVSAIVTPVVYQGHIYCMGRGIASCVDAKTGKVVYKERLPKPKKNEAEEKTDADSQGRARPNEGVIMARRRPGGMDYSSPVIANGIVYQFTKKGICYVWKTGPDFELVAINQFESDKSEFNATPAISDGQMFVRSNKYLYSIGAKKSSKP